MVALSNRKVSEGTPTGKKTRKANEMTQTLVKHDAIRQWAAARSGNPAMEDRVGGDGPLVLRILFDQEGLNSGESQYGDRVGGLDLVGWDEWFEEFDRLRA